MAALDLILFVDDHVVAQVVEAELVVGAVGHVGGIGFFARAAVQIVNDQADGKAQKAVDLAHPFRVAPGQVVVDGHDMHALARQAVQVGGQRRHQGFALAGLHLGDAALVQHNAAQHLHGEVPHPQHAVGGFPADGERVGQDALQRLAVRKALPERGGLGLQLFVGHRLVFAFQFKNGVADGLDALELPPAVAAEQFFQNRVHDFHL